MVRDLNIISSFLSHSDIPTLTPSHVQSVIGSDKADLLILLGNSIVESIDLAAQVLKKRLITNFLVAGGKGHSTHYLVESVQNDPRYTGSETKPETEAKIIREVLTNWHSINPNDLIIENQSTNCGSNADKSRKVVEGLSIVPSKVILIQDPTMQLRTHASFRWVYRDQPDIEFYNFPPFIPKVENQNGKLKLANDDIKGIWKLDRFLSLIMGEIPRLRDDKHGYGPNGRGFIAHVDIPDAVEKAYQRLLVPMGDYVR